MNCSNYCSNGMDVVLGESQLTFKTIGGIVDLYIFSGPTPAGVMDQMTSTVGRPALVPYWSLGFRKYCRKIATR
jgi:alpha-glucosidase (family GH31 glycosyl hydrolase)